MRINFGTTANDRTGDTLRTWAQKFNASWAVISATTAAQPATPAEGDIYIVPAGATGAAWSPGHTGKVAFFINGAWELLTPVEGWRYWVRDTDAFVVWNGTAWAPISTGGGGGGGGFPFTLGAQISAAYNVTNADLAGGVYKEATGTFSITVPSGLTGTQPFTIENVGTGVITIAPGAGVTINARGGVRTLTDRWSAATLIRKSLDVYSLVGGMA